MSLSNFFLVNSALDCLFSEVSSCLDLADPRSLIFGTRRVSFRSAALRIINSCQQMRINKMNGSLSLLLLQFWWVQINEFIDGSAVNIAHLSILFLLRLKSKAVKGVGSFDYWILTGGWRQGREYSTTIRFLDSSSNRFPSTPCWSTALHRSALSFKSFIGLSKNKETTWTDMESARVCVYSIN